MSCCTYIQRFFGKLCEVRRGNLAHPIEKAVKPFHAGDGQLATPYTYREKCREGWKISY